MNVERLRLAQLHHQLTVVETVASDAIYIEIYCGR